MSIIKPWQDYKINTVKSLSRKRDDADHPIGRFVPREDLEHLLLRGITIFQSIPYAGFPVMAITDDLIALCRTLRCVSTQDHVQLQG